METIQLIERDLSRSKGNYGDLKIFASYLGFKEPPHFTSGEITHGWINRERNIEPDLVIGSNGLGYKRKAHRFFVARKDQEDYLRSQGFKDVHAIGHPITYIDSLSEVKRIKNSLLVMPAHSLPKTSEDWRETDLCYANFLCDCIKEFDYVALCLHISDINKGNWKNLKEVIPLTFEGAIPNDRNSYLRMGQLFSYFEYVTSNEFGSHVAYASYFGAKVSVCGPRIKWKKHDYESLEFYKNSPHLLNIMEDWHVNNRYMEWYPQFCCSPREAKTHVEWAKWELGSQYKRTQIELKKLLNWTKYGQVNLILRKIINKLYLAD
jgi:hypothetical protein